MYRWSSGTFEAFQQLDMVLAETVAQQIVIWSKSECRCWPRYAAPMELVAIFCDKYEHLAPTEHDLALEMSKL
jgi:hypothetical protein